MNTKKLKAFAEAIRSNVNVSIDKQDTRRVDDGNIFHCGTLTDEKGNEFPFTVTEMKMNGSIVLDLTWIDDAPFKKETDIEPYTIDGSKQDLRRATIGTIIVEQFTAMAPNVELEDQA